MRALPALLALLLAAPPALAAPEGSPLAFAEHLSRVEPGLAILEYERFLDLNPGHALASTARQRVVALYLAQHDLLRAQRHLQALLDEAPPAKKPRVSLELASLQELKGWPELARDAYEKLSHAPEIRPEALKRLLWLEIRARRWEAAVSAATRLPSTSKTSLLIERLQGWQARPTRSTALAQGLSAVLPGSGQVYAGDWASGLVSFSLNAAWIGLLSVAVMDRDWVGGGFVANYGPRYYLGGIQTAGNLVDQERLRDDRRFIQALEKDFADLLPLK